VAACLLLAILTPPPVAVVLSAVAGAGAGWLGRMVLGRVGIVARPPWCEVSSAVLSAVVAAEHLPARWLAVPLLLTWLGVPLTAADLLCRRLPNVLTVPAYPLLALAITLSDPSVLLRAVIGAALFGGAHLVIRLIAPASIGAGDVKLAGSLGIVLGALGWADLALAATLGAFGTLVLAIVTRSRHAAHGPGLLAATWLVATLTPLPALSYV
jgi:leader peptidase (prepilin peptidase)/N-methyltransferase